MATDNEQKLCKVIASALADRFDEREVAEFVDHMPELLEIAKNKRTVKRFFKLVDTRKKGALWIGGLLLLWIEINDHIGNFASAITAVLKNTVR